MSYTSKGLREERAGVLAKLNEIVITAKKEGRGIKAEEQETFDRLFAEGQRLEEEARSYERIESFDTILHESVAAPRTAVKPQVYTPRGNDADLALRGWLLRDTPHFKQEYREAAERLGYSYGKTFELRTLTTTTATQGKELVPVDLKASIEEYLEAFGGVRARAFHLNTSAGNPLDVPTNDDTSASGHIRTQNQADDVSDPSFDKVTFNSYTFTSKICLVPWELLADIAININQFLGRILATRIHRATANYYCNGTGSGQPEGVKFACDAGETATDPDTISYSDLLDLYYSVDEAYRNSPSCAWLVSESAAKVLMSILDGADRPLWQVSGGQGNIQVGRPDLLLGRPVYICHELDAVEASDEETKRPVLFGDWSQFWVRNVGNLELMTSSERYFEYRQTAFVAVQRTDSRLINPAAIKALEMPEEGMSMTALNVKK